MEGESKAKLVITRHFKTWLLNAVIYFRMEWPDDTTTLQQLRHVTSSVSPSSLAKQVIVVSAIIIDIPFVIGPVIFVIAKHGDGYISINTEVM